MCVHLCVCIYIYIYINICHVPNGDSSVVSPRTGSVSREKRTIIIIIIISSSSSINIITILISFVFSIMSFETRLSVARHLRSAQVRLHDDRAWCWNIGTPCKRAYAALSSCALTYVALKESPIPKCVFSPDGIGPAREKDALETRLGVAQLKINIM